MRDRPVTVAGERGRASQARGVSKAAMSTYQPPSTSTKPYVEPTPLPDGLPKVKEVGATSGPLKSAAFFIGAYCKDFNGAPRFPVCWENI